MPETYQGTENTFPQAKVPPGTFQALGETVPAQLTGAAPVLTTKLVCTPVTSLALV